MGKAANQAPSHTALCLGCTESFMLPAIQLDGTFICPKHAQAGLCIILCSGIESSSEGALVCRKRLD